jgi:methionyl aminopeptidase
MITIKTPEEIEIITEGGKILAKIMKELEKEVKPGITTKDLDRLAESLILKSGGKCSFKGYQDFPACLCTSVNEEIVHAVPSDRVLKEGDIISLDIGMKYNGFHTDMAVTLPVGKINPETERLIEVTKKALEIGIEKVKPGNYIGDISRIIQKYVESQGFNVVRELCGHGIGREIHEDPQILNSVSMPTGRQAFDKKLVEKVKYVGDATTKIQEGMVLCLEPMVTVGDWHIKKSKDGFGFETKDSSLSCHFEHTMAVTKNGAKILTQSTEHLKS